MNILVLFMSYVLGSLSPSHIITKKLYQKDLNSIGSGNLGAFNIYRNFGIKAGLLVFLLDAAKGVLAVYLAVILKVNPLWAMLGVVGGHNFSMILGFKGGKGLAAALGALIVVDIRYAAVLIGTGLILLLLTKNKYLAAVIMVGIFPLVILFFDPSPLSVLLGLLISFLIIVKHRHNFA